MKKEAFLLAIKEKRDRKLCEFLSNGINAFIQTYRNLVDDKYYHVSVLSYLYTLRRENAISAEELARVLLLNNQSGVKWLYEVVAKGEDQHVSELLNFFKMTVKEKLLEPDMVFNFLFESANGDGSNFACRFAKYQIQHLELFVSLLSQLLPSHDRRIKDALSVKIDGGWTFAHCVAMFRRRYEFVLMTQNASIEKDKIYVEKKSKNLAMFTVLDEKGATRSRIIGVKSITLSDPLNLEEIKPFSRPILKVLIDTCRVSNHEKGFLVWLDFLANCYKTDLMSAKDILNLFAEKTTQGITSIDILIRREDRECLDAITSFLHAIYEADPSQLPLLQSFLVTNSGDCSILYRLLDLGVSGSLPQLFENIYKHDNENIIALLDLYSSGNKNPFVCLATRYGNDSLYFSMLRIIWHALMHLSPLSVQLRERVISLFGLLESERSNQLSLTARYQSSQNAKTLILLFKVLKRLIIHEPSLLLPTMEVISERWSPFDLLARHQSPESNQSFFKLVFGIFKKIDREKLPLLYTILSILLANNRKPHYLSLLRKYQNYDVYVDFLKHILPAALSQRQIRSLLLRSHLAARFSFTEVRLVWIRKYFSKLLEEYLQENETLSSEEMETIAFYSEHPSAHLLLYRHASKKSDLEAALAANYDLAVIDQCTTPGHLDQTRLFKLCQGHETTTSFVSYIEKRMRFIPVDRYPILCQKALGYFQNKDPIFLSLGKFYKSYREFENSKKNFMKIDYQTSTLEKPDHADLGTELTHLFHLFPNELILSYLAVRHWQFSASDDPMHQFEKNGLCERSPITGALSAFDVVVEKIPAVYRLAVEFREYMVNNLIRNANKLQPIAECQMLTRWLTHLNVDRITQEFSEYLFRTKKTSSPFFLSLVPDLPITALLRKFHDKLKDRVTMQAQPDNLSDSTLR